MLTKVEANLDLRNPVFPFSREDYSPQILFSTWDIWSNHCKQKTKTKNKGACCTKSLHVQCSKIRNRPRFFDKVRYQTTNSSIENKHFSQNHVIVSPNCEQPPQSLQNSYIHSHFSASKINGISLIFFSVKNIRLEINF